MTCQHCQTRILDDDHRCRRCGRRVRTTRPPADFPASRAAIAHAYDFARFEQAAAGEPQEAEPYLEAPPLIGGQPDLEQPSLFSNPNPGRVVMFPQTDLRPAPPKQAKVELPRVRPRRKTSPGQQRLEFFGAEEVVSPPQSHIICDAPVAPVLLRMEAAVIDGLLILAPGLAGLALFVYLGGQFSFNKHTAPFWLLTIFTLPVLYKALWAWAGRDTVGMSRAGLQLVDFDGNPPSRERRYQRILGGFISLLAAGIGLIWALVDEDALTWHDHMSSTFPTIVFEA